MTKSPIKHTVHSLFIKIPPQLYLELIFYILYLLLINANNNLILKLKEIIKLLRKIVYSKNII